uniref:Fe2OG dioxygenase domain-containing protein n=1 Tax=Caenorhabditis tropicalis TaxID=1561998 RepID=A0A1I7TQG1_9PELO
MFSTFNFEEGPPPADPPKRINRKDRSVKYLRALSAQKDRQQHVPPRSDQEPSTSEQLAPVINASLPRPGILRVMFRNWISAMEHDERESEPDRDPTTTNAEVTHTGNTGEQRDILPSPPIFVPHVTGWAQVKAVCKDTWLKLRYFYVSENSVFYYYWTGIISIGTIWNMFAMVIFIFDDVHDGYFKQWLYVNLFFDFLFFLDCVVGARMTFDLEGNEVKETTKMFKNYRGSNRFKLDALCLFPIDAFLILDSHKSMLRLVRVFKAYRLYEFIQLTQRRTNFPHFMKILFLLLSCLTLFHWNACIYFRFSLAEGLTEDDENAFGFSYYKVFDPRFPTCDAYHDEGCMYPEEPDIMDIRAVRWDRRKEMYAFWQSNDPSLLQKSLRWTTLGVEYDWNTKQYPTNGRPVPEELYQLGNLISNSLKLGDMKPDATILNYYPPKSALSPHVDKSERSNAPLISMSLGQTAVYLSGALSLSEPPIPLWLRNGDFLIMHGEQRLVYHAIPCIGPKVEKMEFERDEETPMITDYLNCSRINFTIRQVNP